MKYYSFIVVSLITVFGLTNIARACGRAPGSEANVGNPKPQVNQARSQPAKPKQARPKKADKSKRQGRASSRKLSCSRDSKTSEAEAIDRAVKLRAEIERDIARAEARKLKAESDKKEAKQLRAQIDQLKDLCEALALGPWSSHEELRKEHQEQINKAEARLKKLEARTKDAGIGNN